MIAYIQMMTKTTVKKIAPWIIMIIGMLATYFSIKGVINAFSHEKNTMPQIDNLGYINYIVPFLFISVQITFIVVHLFKTWEKEGTELLVISKPFLRRNIILSKFIVILSFVIFINLFYSIVFYLVSGQDDNASNALRMKFALSFGVGSLIVTLIITGICIFFASFLAPLSTLLVTVILAAIFPILSIVVGSFTGSSSGNNDPYNKDIKIASFEGIDKDGNIIENAETIYSYNLNNYSSSSKDTRYQEYQKSLKYDKYVYGDIYYQWSRFYSMFLPKNNQPGQGKIVKENYERIHDSKYSLELANGDKYSFFGDVEENLIESINRYTNYNSWEYDPKKIKTSITVLDRYAANIYQSIQQTSQTSQTSLFNSLSLVQRLQYIDKTSHDYKINVQLSPIDSSNLPDGSHTPSLSDIILYKKILELDNTNNTITKPSKLITQGSKLPTTLVKSTDHVYSHYAKDFIDKKPIIIVWSSIGFMLVLFALIRYTKRDFK